MTRTHKRTSSQAVVDAHEVKEQPVLITREQYIADIKVRWQIHQKEMDALVKDLKKAFEFLKQTTSVLTDKVFYTVTDQ